MKATDIVKMIASNYEAGDADDTLEFRLKRALEPLTTALKPLADIADAYDDNALDDEARKFWGTDNENQNTTPPEQIELYQGRGGKRLLTLQQCLDAREALKELGC